MINRKILITICIATIAIISSCKKEVVNTNTNPNALTLYNVHDTIKGTLYRDCTYAPDSNRKIVVQVAISLLDLASIFLTDSFYTDSHGNFSHPYNYSVSSSSPPDYFLAIQGSVTLYGWQPNIYQTFITGDTVHLKLNLQVTNPHTSADTLYYDCSILNQYNYIVGPFTNGIFKILDLTRTDTLINNYLNYSDVTIFWAIGANNLHGSFNTGPNYNIVNLKHIPCSVSDTATFNVN